jgi:hypothetical protein
LLSEAVLYFMVVFSPWAFGTTQVWSTWVMNGAGYCLGALLVAKWIIRWGADYQPSRWGDPIGAAADGSQAGAVTWVLTRVLAVLTILVLAYCLISALNARATYYHDRRWFDYHECLPWLPHSYDSRSTWFAFWQYLALAWLFWALRDWLLTQTGKERFRLRHGTEEERVKMLERLPSRLRRLLWVLCLNGAVLGLECILQRLDGSNKLLWLVEPRWNKTPESQFGPYAYRSNAAQYFNLVWPVCVGFWWRLRQRSGHRVRVGGSPHALLPVCTVVIAACPLISLSRGGALIMAYLASWAALLFLWVQRSAYRRMLIRIGPILLMAVALAAYLIWPAFRARLVPSVRHSNAHLSSLGEMTLLCSISVPHKPPPQVTVVAGISSGRISPFSRGSLVVFLDSKGNLGVRVYGQTSGDYIERTVPGFVTNYAGADLRLALVKSSDISIIVNGTELSSTEHGSGAAPTWNQVLDATVIWAGRRNSTAHFSIPVFWLSIFDRALGRSDLELAQSQGPVSLQPQAHLELDSKQGRSLAWVLRNLDLSGREVIYWTARRIAAEYPWLGTGAGTFASIYQLYIEHEEQDWAAFAHDDWLEMRITFGWLGFGMVLTMLLLVPAFWWFSAGIRADRGLYGLILAALSGCLLHAKFDFPFQIYSVLHLFLVECALLTCLARTRRI